MPSDELASFLVLHFTSLFSKYLPFLLHKKDGLVVMIKVAKSVLLHNHKRSIKQPLPTNSVLGAKFESENALVIIKAG